MRIKYCFELHHRLDDIGQSTNSTTHPHFFHHPVTKRASVSAVGKILLQARELVSLLLDSLRRTLEDNVSSSFLVRL